jgi:nicotinate-nucleotide--dimethylbenzimidazole phosphoribosyltransferase
VTELDLESFGERIERPDDKIKFAARAAVARVTLPPSGLGRIGDLAAWLAGVRGSARPEPLQRVRMVVVAAEHGIAAGGVSAWPPEATRWLLERVAAGESLASAQAARAGVPVRVVDLGVGTPSGRIDREDALTLEASTQAFNVGVATADEEADAGAELIVLGDIGVGATTPAAALIGILTGSDAAAVTGRGSGIDDHTWMRKCAAIRDAMRRGRPAIADHPALFATAGGADLAALTGLLLQCAVRRTPVVLDGLVSASAALVAQRIAFRSVDWFLASHTTNDPAHRLALDRLALDPVLDLGLSVGEGVGALSVVPLLQAASSLFTEVRTWEPEPAAADPFDDAT